MAKQYIRKDKTKQLLLDYAKNKRLIRDMEMGYIYTARPDGGGGRSSGIGRPTEMHALGMADDADLDLLRRQVAAVEKLMERIAAYPEHKRAEYVGQIRLIYTQRLSAEETAARLGLSVKTVRARNRSLLEYLAGIMAAMGI